MDIQIFGSDERTDSATHRHSSVWIAKKSRFYLFLFQHHHTQRNLIDFRLIHSIETDTRFLQDKIEGIVGERIARRNDIDIFELLDTIPLTVSIGEQAKIAIILHHRTKRN